MNELERELEYYRQQCNELGARALRLQEEQTRARREARRNRTIAKLIREVYQLADANVSLDDIGRRFLRVILDTLNVDRAALLTYLPEQGRFAAGVPQRRAARLYSARPTGDFSFYQLAERPRSAAGLPAPGRGRTVSAVGVSCRGQAGAADRQ